MTTTSDDARSETVTSWFAAAKRGDGETLKSLLDSDSSLATLSDELGNTALHYCCGGGHVEATRALLSRSAPTSARNAVGDTPLHKAAGRGHGEVVRALVEAGADAAATNAMGQTPAQVAGNASALSELSPSGDVPAELLEDEVSDGDADDDEQEEDPQDDEKKP